MSLTTIVTQLLLLVAAACVHTCEGANVLALAIIPSYSHQIPIIAISKALAARGHNVTLVTTDPIKPTANLTQIDVSETYKLFRAGALGFNLTDKKNPFMFVRQLILGMPILVDYQLKSKNIQEFLSWAKDVKYDAALYENMFLSAYLSLIHYVGAPPVIAVSTFESTLPVPVNVGSPLSLAYAPYWQAFTDHMTFYQRIMNVAMYVWYMVHRDWLMYPEHDRITREVFGEGYPTAAEMERNVSLLMHCASGSMYYPQPLTPNVVKIGATHIEKPKPLPEDLEKWVSSAKDGVIYFSLGSNMQGIYMPVEIREAFLNAFARLKNYRVVWKWESDTYFPGQSENVRFTKWIPQQDLLAHPKTKAFITQGGLQSCEETVHFAVPVVGVPLFSDQLPNIRKLVLAEAAVSLDYYYLDTETIYNALDEVLHNPKYKINMKRLSDISKDTVLTPVQQAVWWVEYVIRHRGARHLRPASLDLHWTQYYLIDVAAFFIALACLITFGVFKLCQHIYRLDKAIQMVNCVKHKEKKN